MIQEHDLNAIIFQNVAAALAEDIGSGDVTAKLIPATMEAEATVIAREPAILCGTAWFDAAIKQVFYQAGLPFDIQWATTEGSLLEVNKNIVTIRGNARAMLTAERTALNFLQLLSGTATRTHQFVQAVKGTQTKIVDSRKTIPGLRFAQKYAVQVGGGTNHRFGLFDAILIKDNHIAIAKGIAQVIAIAEEFKDQVKFIQLEVDTLSQLEEALSLGVQMILLDNMSHEQIRKAVEMTQGRAILEVSGGVDIHSVRSYAELGVDRISIGGLTKHVQATDFSMAMEIR